MLADLARSNATVFPGMPVFYQAFCEMEHVPVLPKLAALHFCRRAAPGRIAKKFQEKFNLTIHSFYGARNVAGFATIAKQQTRAKGLSAKR